LCFSQRPIIDKGNEVADQLIQITDDFWNIRGSFKIAGFVEIGTQTSLARLASGGFALLDAYSLTGEIADQIMALTDDGRSIEAILNLHPFHTIHVRETAKRFPGAKLFGSRRHQEKAPELPWQDLRVDEEELHAKFAEDFAFTVPRGVDFISTNEKLHFSSVLALHRSSKTLHVDDTLMFTRLPFVGGLVFHPTLKSVLERRAGAVEDFRGWAEELITLCRGVNQLCTAHAKPLPPSAQDGFALAGEVRGALKKVEKVLHAHAERFA